MNLNFQASYSFGSGMMRRGVWLNMASLGYNTVIKCLSEYYLGYIDVIKMKIHVHLSALELLYF